MYNAKEIEKKWQEIWDKENYYEPSTDFSKEKNISYQCFLTQVVKFTWGM